MIFLEKKNKSSDVHHNKNAKDPVQRGVKLSVFCLKRLWHILDVILSTTVQDLAYIFFLYIVVVILFWNETLNIQSLQLTLKKCRLLWDPSPLCKRNRCEESETREEEILKALEHHQTGKTPTHNRAEKALRSSQASLNGSLSANCATQPPQVNDAISSPHPNLQERWENEWASVLSFSLIFSFYSKWFIPKVLWYLPSVWRFRVLFLSPRKAACHMKHIKKKH